MAQRATRRGWSRAALLNTVAASYAPRAARAADAGVGANPSAPMAVRLRERGTRHGWSSAAVLWNAVTGLNRRSGLIDVRSSVVP